eukprot:12965799-Alexandrium_andersonii.AAC.1
MPLLDIEAAVGHVAEIPVGVALLAPVVGPVARAARAELWAILLALRAGRPVHLLVGIRAAL